MRHYYFRLFLGIVFLCCMVFSFATLNLPFALLYLTLGIRFLASACFLRKKENDNRR